MTDQPLWFMTTLSAIVEDWPDGYEMHIDGPVGYQAIVSIADSDDPKLKIVTCKNGQVYTRVSYAPVFASVVDESGL